METKTQRAKALYDQLRKNNEIDILFSGLYKDIWVTGKRKAYRVVDLGLDHLSNIIEYAHTKEEEPDPAILVAYELKKKMYERKDHIKLKSIHVVSVTKRMYIVDPDRVPPELADKNILSVQQPIVVTATTEDDRVIPVILTDPAQLTIHATTEGPE